MRVTPHYDRMLIIGIVPTSVALAFGENLTNLVGTEFVLERRELGSSTSVAQARL